MRRLISLLTVVALMLVMLAMGAAPGFAQGQGDIKYTKFPVNTIPDPALWPTGTVCYTNPEGGPHAAPC